MSSRQALAGAVQSIKTTESYLPSLDAAATLYVRGKSTRKRGAQARPVIFIHGATYPGSAVFDWAMFGGISWLDDMALAGFDAYLFDVRGYGRSQYAETTRTQTLSRTPEAIADLATVVAWVLDTTCAEQVDLVGWSWGTAIGAGYAIAAPDRVRRLVLNAPLWMIRQDLMMAFTGWIMAAIPESDRLFGPYRNVTREDAYRRWIAGLEAEVAGQLIPRAEFDAWWDAMVEPGPFASESIHRAPTGVLVDLMRCWGAGSPTYDPRLVRSPTLLTIGEWDRDTPPYMALELFGRLTRTPYKRLEILSRGTHAMLMEAHRTDLFREIRDFLSEPLR